MPQYLVMAECLPIIRQAYAEQRLSAQNKTTGGGCKYSSGENIGCAIGVCLSAETKKEIMQKQLNSDLLYVLLKGNILTVAKTEMKDFGLLQYYHDYWQLRNGESKFLAELAELERKYMPVPSAT